MSENPSQTPTDNDPTRKITDSLEALRVSTLSDAQLRRLHAALTYMHEVLAKETERRADNDDSGDTVRVTSAKIMTD